MLHVERVGHGIPLVLLHGWGMHGGIWQQLAKELQSSFQLTIIDLPGFGYSYDHPIEGDIQSFLQPVAEQITVPSLVLGWSLGGLVANQLAMQYPEKILGLIQICTSPKFVAEDNWPGMSADSVKKFHQLLANDYEKTIEHFLLLQLYRSDNMKADTARMKKLVLSRPKPNIKALQYGLQLLENTDQRQLLSKLTLPQLHIFGQLDRIVPDATALKVATMNQHITVELMAQTTHMPFVTHQAKFYQLLTNYLTNTGFL